MRIIFDEKNIQQLLDKFSRVSSICSSVFDTQFQSLVGANARQCPFCEYMRKDPGFCEGCEISNRTAMQHVSQTHETYIYECHAGLTEVLVPIMADQTVFCYLMIGQFLLTDDSSQCWEHSLKICRNPRIAGARLQYDQILRMTHEQLEAWIDILKSYICYQTLKPYILIQTDNDFQRIQKYVTTHLSEKLTARRICEELAVSKNRIYDQIYQNTQLTLNEYINQQRIQYACRQLSETTATITDIAFNAGYTDYSYFLKVFRKFMLCTPAMWRKHSKQTSTEFQKYTK